MLIYILPIIIFIVTSIVLYMLSTDPKKKSISSITVRNILPATVLAITVFCIIKFKDNLLFKKSKYELTKEAGTANIPNPTIYLSFIIILLFL